MVESFNNNQDYIQQDLNESNISISNTNEQTSGDLIIADNQYVDLPMDTFEAEMAAEDPHVIEIYEEKNPYK